MTRRSALGRLLDTVATGVVTMLAVLTAPRRKTVRRSLWAGTPIINMATNARAERLLGVDARSLVDHTYFLTEEFDYDLSPWMRWPVLRWFVPYVVLFWACTRFDRFHFYCDRGLLPSRDGHAFHPGELSLLKRIGKEVFFWTYGADVRTRHATRALGEPNCCTECPLVGAHCTCDDVAGRENVARLVASADGVFAMGDMQEYTPGSRNDLFFWPVDIHGPRAERYRPAFPNADSADPLRIVHAPNHRHFKGTRHLLEAVERLQGEGIAIDLVLVERVPNAEALEIYRSADLVFDQCLVGFHGYFALEAMAMGKPVMVFIRKPAEYLLDHDNCPLVNTPRELIADRIRELATDRARLHDIGVAGRRYIETHFSLEAFAGRLARAYRKDTDDASNGCSSGGNGIRRTTSHPAAA